MQFIGSNLKKANLNLAYVDGDTTFEGAKFEEPSIVDGACKFMAFQRVSIRLSCAHTNRCCTNNFGHCRQRSLPWHPRRSCNPLHLRWESVWGGVAISSQAFRALRCTALLFLPLFFADVLRLTNCIVVVGIYRS